MKYFFRDKCRFIPIWGPLVLHSNKNTHMRFANKKVCWFVLYVLQFEHTLSSRHRDKKKEAKTCDSSFFRTLVDEFLVCRYALYTGKNSQTKKTYWIWTRAEKKATSAHLKNERKIVFYRHLNVFCPTACYAFARAYGRSSYIAVAHTRKNNCMVHRKKQNLHVHYL